MVRRYKDPFDSIANALSTAEVERPVEIELVQLSAKGMRVGMSNPAARWSDEVVAKARELYASGMTYKAVGLALGVHWAVVQKWIGRSPSNARRVTPVARIVAKRKK